VSDSGEYRACSRDCGASYAIVWGVKGTLVVSKRGKYHVDGQKRPHKESWVYILYCKAPEESL